MTKDQVYNLAMSTERFINETNLELNYLLAESELIDGEDFCEVIAFDAAVLLARFPKKSIEFALTNLSIYSMDYGAIWDDLEADIVDELDYHAAQNNFKIDISELINILKYVSSFSYHVYSMSTPIGWAGNIIYIGIF